MGQEAAGYDTCKAQEKIYACLSLVAPIFNQTFCDLEIFHYFYEITFVGIQVPLSWFYKGAIYMNDAKCMNGHEWVNQKTMNVFFIFLAYFLQLQKGAKSVRDLGQDPFQTFGP